MRNCLLLTYVVVMFLSQNVAAQTMEELSKSLPSHFSVLVEWGLRPDWDEKSENIYFLNKMVGDVFKINIKTRKITAVTSHFYHAGIFRAQCLPNGDLLLAIGGEDFDPKNPEKHRHHLQMYILPKGSKKKPIPLGEFCDEGPAVSKSNMTIAWTLPGQRVIQMGNIEYVDGLPKLVNKKTIVDYSDSSPYVRLETQDFRPPHDKELIYTHYWGDERDAFFHAETFGLDLETGKYVNYTNSPDSYDEAEGIFPCGKYTMIESDRHQDEQNRLRWKVDIYRLKLDGSGEVERLADFSTRYPNILRSDNPVVDKTGRYIALQYGFMAGAGDGQGIFLFDMKEYEKNKKKNKKR
jgi:hypothetical protein